MYIKTYPSWWHFLLCISNSTSGSSTALPTATVNSEVNLFQHGLPFGCTLSRVCLLCHGLTHGQCLEVLQHDLMHRRWCFKVHLLQCGFIHSHQCLMCMLPSPAWAYSWPTIPAEVCLQWHRHTPRCFEMYQLLCGLIHGHRCFGVSCSCMDSSIARGRVDLTSQWSSSLSSIEPQECSDALALCHLRHVAMAVIKMFPDVAE